MKTKIGHFHDRLEESRRKLVRIADKRYQISLTEGLLQTCEELPEEKRDYDNERRLRAKLRAKRCQLAAMCPL